MAHKDWNPFPADSEWGKEVDTRPSTHRIAADYPLAEELRLLRELEVVLRGRNAIGIPEGDLLAALDRHREGR